MRIGPISSVLAVAALLSCSIVSFPQTVSQSPKKPESSAAEVTVHDLSGVWMAGGPLRHGIYADGTDEADDFTYRHVPYPMLPWAEEKFKYNIGEDGPYASGRNEMNPSLTNCSPQGPTIDWLFTSTPFEIIQSPKRVLIIHERNHEIRQIWTDGREHPKDFGHTWMGHSIGHWEGDTLVADTIGLNDKTWLDHAGHVHSDALHLIERLQRVGDKLTLTITFDDPKTFTMPWSAFKTFHLKSNWEIEEVILCEDKFLGRTIPLR